MGTEREDRTRAAIEKVSQCVTEISTLADQVSDEGSADVFGDFLATLTGFLERIKRAIVLAPTSFLSIPNVEDLAVLLRQVQSQLRSAFNTSKALESRTNWSPDSMASHVDGLFRAVDEAWRAALPFLVAAHESIIGTHTWHEQGLGDARELRRELEDARKQIANTTEAANKALDLASAEGLASAYNVEAGKAESLLTAWVAATAFAVVFTVIAGLILATATWTNEMPFSWPTFMARAVGLGTFLVLIAFLQSQAVAARDWARFTKNRHLQLTTLSPYIEGLAPERADAIREKLVEQVFQPYAPARRGKAEASSPLDAAKQVTALVKELTELSKQFNSAGSKTKADSKPEVLPFG